jgi:hypothetical protein
MTALELDTSSNPILTRRAPYTPGKKNQRTIAWFLIVIDRPLRRHPKLRSVAEFDTGLSPCLAGKAAPSTPSAGRGHWMELLA